MTDTLSAAQQAQLDNRDATGQWKAKTHSEVDEDADVLGLDGSSGVGPEPLEGSVSDDSPKVWIGSEGAYAAGKLVGDWYDAGDAADVTVEDLYRNQGLDMDLNAGEEVAVMDHENLGVKGSISPQRATELAETFDQIEANHGADGVAAYKALIGGRPGDEISSQDFEDAYAGDHDSAAGFAEEFVSDTTPDSATRRELEHYASYVDGERIARDLEIEDPGPEDDEIDDYAPDYQQQAEEVIQSWVDEGDGASIKSSIDYEFLARDWKIGGDMDFIDRTDGTGVHAFYSR